MTILKTVDQLLITRHTRILLLETGTELCIDKVEPLICKVTGSSDVEYYCTDINTYEKLRFRPYFVNAVTLEDNMGNTWNSKVLAIMDDKGYKQYAPEAFQFIRGLMDSSRNFGWAVLTLGVASVAIACMHIYLGILFLILAGIGAGVYFKQADHTKTVLDGWGGDLGLPMAIVTGKQIGRAHV